MNTTTTDVTFIDFCITIYACMYVLFMAYEFAAKTAGWRARVSTKRLAFYTSASRLFYRFNGTENSFLAGWTIVEKKKYILLNLKAKKSDDEASDSRTWVAAILRKLPTRRRRPNNFINRSTKIVVGRLSRVVTEMY